MKRFLLLAIAAAGLTAWAGLRSESGEQPKAPAEGGKTMFKAVIHINFADAERQKHGLKNVANMLKEIKGAGEIEVVCHGGGIGLVVKDQGQHVGDVERLVKEGVKFVACENTMRDKSIPKENLLPGVVTVPSGAVEVIRKQQDGYGYFKP